MTRLIPEHMRLVLIAQIFTIFSHTKATAQLKAQVERISSGNGFHREVLTHVEVVREDGGPMTDPGMCRLLLVETIPSGAYIDIYQIAQAEPFGGPQVISDYIDIEKPEYLSESHQVPVYSEMKTVNNLIEGDVTLPVHLRYHRPHAGGHQGATVTINHPQLMINCSGLQSPKVSIEERPCSAKSTHICQWQHISYTTESQPLTFQVPVGNSDHTLLVAIVTISTTVIGCVYLIHIVTKYPLQKTKSS